jgi:hypothetical protein
MFCSSTLNSLKWRRRGGLHPEDNDKAEEGRAEEGKAGAGKAGIDVQETGSLWKGDAIQYNVEFLEEADQWPELYQLYIE